MPRGKKFTAEQIIGKLREAEAGLAQGKAVPEGSCMRLRPMHRNHVWSYDFVMDQTADGRVIRMLTIVDEYTRECRDVPGSSGSAPDR